MSLHDLFTQAGRDRATRRLRLRLARRLLGLPGRPGLPRRGPGCSARATARRRRRLAVIDRALARETPRLASMFAMFNELAAEEPVGAERLPPRTWPRPRLAQVAFLATLAAFVAMCVVLSTQVHSVMRPCLTPASGRPAASSPAPPSAAPAASSSSSVVPASSSSSVAPAASSPASPFAPPLASSSASPFAQAPAGPAGGASGLAAFVPVRGLSCQAYAAPNK